MKFRLAAFWIAVLLTPTARAVDSFVVPNSSEAVEGDSNNALPFGSPSGNTRYQQVYLDDDIPPGPFPIYGIAFRPNGIDPVQPSFDSVIPDVDVFLGTTAQGTDLNAEFALNIGPSYTLMASGPLALASAASGPGGGPLAFDIEIWFDQPFAYTGGNLLLDVFVQPHEPTGSRLFDAVNLDSDPVGRVLSVGLSGGGVDETTGTADTQGLVTKFLLVPEPAGTAVAALGALAALVRGRRAREVARGPALTPPRAASSTSPRAPQ